MFSSAQTLRRICLESLRQQISCKDRQQTPEGVATNCEQIKLNGYLVEELLESISEYNELTDDLLLRPIFQSGCCQLKSVRILRASRLTLKGLQTLKSHPIEELSVIGLKNCTIDELIQCLSEYSLLNLRLFNVSRCLFIASNQLCLTKLQSLQDLDVSHTNFNNNGLDIVVENLPLLQCLNISATHIDDISPLKKCRDRLRSLTMYYLSSLTQDFVSILLELNHLVHLDISGESYSFTGTALLLRHPDRFPRLQSLDISGRKGIDRLDLERFLLYKKTREECDQIQFLGLMNTSLDSEELVLTIKEWYDSEIIITGNGSEEQIKESLRHYQRRPTLIASSLFNLYNLTLNYSGPQSDLIELIVRSMKTHINCFLMIFTYNKAIDCLYNLTKNEFGDRIHPNTLKSVIDVILMAMKTFPTNKHLQTMSLFILNSHRVLYNLSFDRFLCSELVLDTLVVFEDTEMNETAVTICSILVSKLSTTDIYHLGAKPEYMETLLEIVRQRVTTSVNNDIMLKNTMEILWNLTDESPNTCDMFFRKGGFDLYLKILKEFEGEVAVEMKARVLGLLINIAEIPQFRTHFMNSEFLVVLRDSMKSSEMNMSYFATGIIAHLCYDSVHWNRSLIDLSEVLDEVERVVLSWDTSNEMMVNYRSFFPFLPLLNCFELPAVQLWAIWAIHHNCSINPKLYCQMLVDVNGIKTIEWIIGSTDAKPHNHLRQYCEQTLDIIRHEFPNLFIK